MIERRTVSLFAESCGCKVKLFDDGSFEFTSCPVDEGDVLGQRRRLERAKQVIAELKERYHSPAPEPER